jgi:hypothetical protein
MLSLTTPNNELCQLWSFDKQLLVIKRPRYVLLLTPLKEKKIILAMGEAETGEIVAQGQPGQKVNKTRSQQISQAWWYMPVIPDMHEA